MLPGGRGEELVIIAAIALIVVGPKDLPKLLRQVGRFVGKMRRMADEFKASFEDMARQSELDDLRKEVDALRANKLPGVFEDVKNEMRALGNDIKDSVNIVPGHTSVDIPAMPDDPQMQGLPPAADLPPITPSAPQPAPEPAKKSARTRKAPTPAEPPAVVIKRAPKKKAPSDKVTS